MAHLAKSSRANAVRRAVTIGRAVRDAFESLSRSMNVLGQRTGVGGEWQDQDAMSAKLRARAINLACKDVRVSMNNCCGMAAIYGLSALAIGVATGIAASPDMYVLKGMGHDSRFAAMCNAAKDALTRFYLLPYSFSGRVVPLKTWMVSRFCRHLP